MSATILTFPARRPSPAREEDPIAVFLERFKARRAQLAANRHKPARVAAPKRKTPEGTP
jgi:hypothetical protein